MVVSPDADLRRSIAFVIEAEGFNAIAFANLGLVQISGMASRCRCAVIDEIAAGNAGDLSKLGGLPIVILGDGSAPPDYPMTIHYVRKPILGINLMRIIRQILFGKS